MNDPVFLTSDQILAFHRQSIERYGGTLGLRDESGFEAAVNHPQNVSYYGHGDLFDLAAAYAFHLAEAQCFVDGNKRTAIISALVFLRVNGMDHNYPEERLYDLMIGIAEKRRTKVDLAEFLRTYRT